MRLFTLERDRHKPVGLATEAFADENGVGLAARVTTHTTHGLSTEEVARLIVGAADLSSRVHVIRCREYLTDPAVVDALQRANATIYDSGFSGQLLEFARSGLVHLVKTNDTDLIVDQIRARDFAFVEAPNARLAHLHLSGPDELLIVDRLLRCVSKSRGNILFAAIGCVGSLAVGTLVVEMLGRDTPTDLIESVRNQLPNMRTTPGAFPGQSVDHHLSRPWETIVSGHCRNVPDVLREVVHAISAFDVSVRHATVSTRRYPGTRPSVNSFAISGDLAEVAPVRHELTRSLEQLAEHNESILELDLTRLV